MIPSPACASAANGHRRRSCPTSSSRARARAGRSSSTARPCRACSSTAAIMSSSFRGQAGQGRQGVARRVPGKRQLAGQGARPARTHDRQGRDRARQAAGGLLPPRRRAAPKPLTLRAVADAIGMHESTVSRVTSNKYLSCERGTVRAQIFLHQRGGQAADGGDAVSAEAVKSHIARLIAAEGRRHPVRRQARRSAERPQGLRHRAPHRRQISRGDRPRLVGPAAACARVARQGCLTATLPSMEERRPSASVQPLDYWLA